ncbi:site-specific integrase [Photobacterium damselae]|uniref:site-specific integrase n=1 Tax=Photobacterium damselae TaxID=38293 RepID=UPI00189EBE44|nr:site-specific integrase [Photobacterium damselae]MBF7101116.1 site-specific integrase [Photobacterium damselae]
MRLTEHSIAQLEPKTATYLVRDGKEPSLVVQVFPNGRKAYQVRTRIDDKVKTRTLGNVDSLALKAAREQTKKQVNAWESSKNGILHSPTLATFANNEWQAQVFNRWKPRTQRTAHYYLHNQILPALGEYALVNLTYPIVNDWFERYSLTAKGGANRALDVLKSVFVLAMRLGYCQYDPCRLIKRNPKKRFNRFLSRDELKTVGDILRTLEDKSASYQQQANIVRMLLLTGCRVSEILTLQWTMIKPNLIDLPDSKTGARTVYLSEDATAILALQPKTQTWVFPAPHSRQPYKTIANFWQQVRTLANVPEVRIHDLRHTFASYAALQGNSVPMIAKMLGHSRFSMTLRYAHVHEHDIVMAAERIGESYEALFHSGKYIKKAPTLRLRAKQKRGALKAIKIRFTATELSRLDKMKQGDSLECWLCELLKRGVIFDKRLDERERLYRVRAKYEHYKQKHYDTIVILMLTPEEYEHFNRAAKSSNLRLSAWSRVKALDACYGL